MTKTYKSLSSALGVVIEVNGVTKRAVFHQDFIDSNGRWGTVYTTDDKEEQKAIEAHPYFRSGFKNQIWTDDVEESVEELSVEPVAETPVEPAKKTRKKKEE